MAAFLCRVAPLFLVSVGVIGYVVACGKREAPPNVLLISIDTLRPDHLGCYGAQTVETPAIDRLAGQGLRFDQAFTPIPLTLPAHWTLHTGVEPWHHGVVDNGISVSGTSTAAPVFTLAEKLAEAGYDTAAFVAAFVLHRSFGLDRGFALYDDGPGADAALDQLLHATAPADERVGRALQWLRARSAVSQSEGGTGKPTEGPRPFFLWIHLFDPHAPYLPPPEFRARYGNRLYDGEIAFVDTQIGRLMAGLERLGLAENTLVVLTSDHGESLGEHGEQTHGMLLYDATLRIPLILRKPDGSDAGQTRQDLVTLADVAPTILNLVGLQIPPSLDGQDLLATKRGHDDRSLGALSEAPRRRLGWAPLRVWRNSAWKFIAAPKPELYETKVDRHELRNRFGEERRLAKALEAGARALDEALAASRARVDLAEPSAEEQAALAALGYIQHSGSSPRSPATALPNPVEQIFSLGELDLAYQLMAEGQLEAAKAKFLALVEQSERPAIAALEGLARIARHQGANAEAEMAFRRLLVADPSSLTALAQMVLLLKERGDKTGSLEFARRLQALAPRDGGASRLLAEALLATGDPVAAEAEWRRGLSVSPRADYLRLSYARFLVAAGRRPEAQAEIDRLLERPELPEALRDAAKALQ